MERAIEPPYERDLSIRRSGLTRFQRRNLNFFLFLSPWLFGLICLSLFPVGYGLYISMTNYDGLVLAGTKFTGLANYVKAFADPDMIFSMKQTFLWVLLNVPGYLVISFGLALLLNQSIKARGTFRTLYYLPSIIPAVAAVSIWRIILDKNIGLLNGVLSLFKPGTSIAWLGTYAIEGLTLISLWLSVGFGMVIFLAGLQGIPVELLEAARIDGANEWQSFRFITLPLMTPVIFFQLITSLLGQFQQLNLPLLIGGNNALGSLPPRDVYLFAFHTLVQIRTGRYGYGLSLLWILFVVVLLITALVFVTERFWVYKADGEEEKR
jgi:multiple sugar transport system permease protein